MIKLNTPTPSSWLDAVLSDFDSFLLDHAAAEKKAAGMAISMLSHYPDRSDLVTAMIDLSIEEMLHFKQVVALLHERGLQIAADQKDEYVNAFRKHLRKDSEHYFLDRLLVGGIIEARGNERFGLIATALEQGQIKNFYTAITESEAKHANLFTQLATQYFPNDEVQERMTTLLDIESDIMIKLPIKAALH